MERVVMPEASEADQNVLCLYHDDADGRCSAAIVRKALGPEVILVAMDYEFAVPWSEIEAADKILIVDFSFPLDQMQRMMSQAEVIWIDHHKTSLEALESLSDMPGLRSLEEAGCVLTWRYFFPDQTVPDAVRYVGDRDVWRFAYEHTAAFGEGLFQEASHPSNDALWKPLLENDQALVLKLIERGEILYRARMNQIRRLVKREGFEVKFEGHRTLAINSHGSGDLGHHMCQEGYEVAYCYIDRYHNGKLLTKVALFSETIDVAELASRFGGGGHPGAAGFSFIRSDSPFPGGAEVKYD
jgi:hypothetical protein